MCRSQILINGFHSISWDGATTKARIHSTFFILRAFLTINESGECEGTMYLPICNVDKCETLQKNLQAAHLKSIVAMCLPLLVIKWTVSNLY
mmetsp:Transcript_7254/g.15338  ORF Transcript_7254/g.15338 Transcript_7254/m.15338 type:complete len:92 (+) Transcript_7254:90-365(+)